ncbi:MULTISPECIES: DUF2934 domain-containing protein [Sphingobium]|jgi:hypothetical protein|uniref:DUF2934 domain-containing protein n=2 Tax=Sphingobium fuliginis (strain ATCC 27551) TaxID=336203 RepID=A0A292ZN47_SPHSA|nr:MULTISPECIES: DUF2934 domain-containing protein [Sphingobium]OAP33573.1 hypothetical protein A8O16_02595 [Sphingobium sp. 20006FA]AJR23435.1 hypothetical protein TZ53_06545 [Sphingobium sp. YBL2]MCB4860239.1 DUF2934 domain-containing protein [Sphingobium sp. PNB]QOT74105.1 DUF2934 domain-containing protein [Sphingobium fuliginis]RYL98207.1 DUF2934 domain-containing protein [Sphingobium fuliginis]
MPDDTEDRIRERAYAIWEAQGHPEGLAEDHWRQAEAEIGGLPEDSTLPNPLATGAAAELLSRPASRTKSA